MEPTASPAPAPAKLTPNADYFRGQLASLESELAAAHLKVAHLTGALNLVRGQAALFFPADFPPPAKPAAPAPAVPSQPATP